MGHGLKISFILPQKDCWMRPYIESLARRLRLSHDVKFYYGHDRLRRGDAAFFLSYDRIVPASVMRQHQHNLIVHESDLPKGRGWSPLTWQILEGKKRIPIVLFEAGLKVDSGPVYFKEWMVFEGHELVDELRRKQAEATIRLIKKFFSTYPPRTTKKQRGRPTYYHQRTPADSEVNTTSTLKEIFNLLRVSDNERYPVFFRYKKHCYKIKIYKKDMG